MKFDWRALFTGKILKYSKEKNDHGIFSNLPAFNTSANCDLDVLNKQLSICEQTTHHLSYFDFALIKNWINRPRKLLSDIN